MLISLEQQIKNLQHLYTVPVYPNQKRPKTKHSYYDGIKYADIKSWLSRVYNIGISLPLSNLACIDVDMHGKEDGLTEYKRLCEKYGIIDTYTEVTATGNGLHLFIRDDGITANNCDLAPGVEFKRNSMIVCSPSQMKGVQYKISDDDGLIKLFFHKTATCLAYNKFVAMDSSEHILSRSLKFFQRYKAY